MSNEVDEEHLRLFAALQDAAAISGAGTRKGREGVTPASQIVAYARRRDAVVDMSIERLIRTSPVARQIHAQALIAGALAQSPIAMAAAGGTNVVRYLGPHRVELIEDAGGEFLVIHLGPGSEQPVAIEARDPEGEGSRLVLGEPIAGILQMRLDISGPEVRAFRDALARTDSAVFLI